MPFLALRLPTHQGEEPKFYRATGRCVICHSDPPDLHGAGSKEGKDGGRQHGTPLEGRVSAGDVAAVSISRPTAPRPAVRRVARRRPTYGEPVIRLLAEIWAASGYLCGLRLKAALPHWLPWLQRRTAVPPALAAQLQRISPRQMDRRLRDRKQRIKRRLYGTTRPGALLKHQIPIKPDHWEVTTPGYLESDRVSHSGASAAGEFLHTLDCVDMQTTWVERQAVRGKSRQEIVQALTTLEAQLPFALRGVDSDNGSEFINDHLLAWCQTRPRRPLNGYRPARRQIVRRSPP